MKTLQTNNKADSEECEVEQREERNAWQIIYEV